MSSSSSSRLYSFGIIADPQYADVVDGHNHKKTNIRRHRQSLQTVKAASKYFCSQSTTCNIILGDILDGKAGSAKIHEKCIDDIFAETRKHSANWHFVVGNHDLYCFPRDHLQQKFIPAVNRCSMKDNTRLYYDFSPFAGFRYIILDAFDVSDISASSPQNLADAIALLCAKNPNYAAGNDDWYAGLTDYESRFCPSNGAIGAEQLCWLEVTLQSALAAQEKCIVCCHVPAYGPATKATTLLWNAEEVLAVLHRFPNVIAYLAGHDHSGGYAQDSAGIHHIVPPAPLECAEGEVAYGIIEVFPTHLHLDWTGKVPIHTSWPTLMHYKSS